MRIFACLADTDKQGVFEANAERIVPLLRSASTKEFVVLYGTLSKALRVTVLNQMEGEHLRSLITTYLQMYWILECLPEETGVAAVLSKLGKEHVQNLLLVGSIGYKSEFSLLYK